MTAEIVSIIPAIRARQMKQRLAVIEKWSGYIDDTVLPLPTPLEPPVSFVRRVEDRRRAIDIAYAQKELRVMQDQRIELEAFIDRMPYHMPMGLAARKLVELIQKMRDIETYIQQKEDEGRQS